MQLGAKMLTKGQIRAARAFLGWSAKELAERAGVHRTTVQRVERHQGPLRGNVDSLHKIEEALEGAGIVFHTITGCPGLCLGKTPEDGQD